MLGTFYYPWTAGNLSVSPSQTWRHWIDDNHKPPKSWASNYLPDFMPIFDPCNELYSSKDISIIKRQLALMKRAKFQFIISSWWGQNSYEDQSLDIIFNQVLSKTCNPYKEVKFCIYYEKELLGAIPKSEIISDINYIKQKYSQSQYYLKINNKPVIFIYNPTEGLGNETPLQEAQKWKQVRDETNIYTVLKIFHDYQLYTNLADSFHQYGPSTHYASHPPYSAFVSPGFHKWHENPRLTREDFTRFENDIITLSQANVQFKLIETWNEWGEGTGIEPAQKIIHDDVNGFKPNPSSPSYGTKYIDIIAKHF